MIELLQAEERVSALRDAVEELGHLEEYVRAMKPSKQDAIGLAVRPFTFVSSSFLETSHKLVKSFKHGNQMQAAC